MKETLPEVLAKVKGLEVRTKIIVYGVLSGIHKSAFKGQSLEFSEHRPYTPGDDPRYIDWKAYGKFDRYFLKQFEHSSSVDVFLIIDTSNSMDFGNSPMTKLEYSKTLSASIAYLMLSQGDRIGLIYPGYDGEKMLVKPSSGMGHFNSIVNILEGIDASGSLNFGRFLQDVLEVIKKNSIVLLFSDFLDDERDITGALKTLGEMKTDTRLFHIFDRKEVDFPFSGEIIFRGLEKEGEISVNARKVKKVYMEKIKDFENNLRETCISLGFSYTKVVTYESFVKIIYSMLSSIPLEKTGV